ncbi:DNA repair protein RadC [Erwinia sp. E602]|uniref:RadC family protein n=1 Tax=unclassified Erwinia TaxID=2622719 RepID=UPI0006FC9345|nr:MULTISPECIES: DNA repair protein RadC [unclassified Erwinia]KQN63284.1 hypothetical protein ASF13_19960 [Erwinia sp. Leaf53]PLV53285.1 hypothetical protein NV64_18875 [Erwinia sp. B116]QUG77690.1 DNA repair protein RadC [Erwinia sp. E602]
MDNNWNGMAPREKLIAHGVETLSDCELLAIFLRTGIRGRHVMKLAQQLMAEFGSLYQLMNASRAEFREGSGVGAAKFAQLNAVAELARRCFSCRDAIAKRSVTSTRQLLDFLQGSLAQQEREIFQVVFFDNQHRVIHVSEMFSGTINSVEVHPREIVREALKRNAAAIILAHNHPSGVAEPSQADRDITAQIVRACSLMDIRVLDHMVIGHGQYVSFAERGWL